MKLAHASRVAASLLAGLCCAVHAALPTIPSTATAVAPEPVRSFGAAGLLQAGMGLAIVLALIFGCAWLARRFGLQKVGSTRLIKVVSSAMVGQRERVVVVEIGDSWLVLGVTANQVNALHTMPAGSLSDADAASTVRGMAGMSGDFSRKLLESLNKLRKQD